MMKFAHYGVPQLFKVGGAVVCPLFVGFIVMIEPRHAFIEIVV
jgi:hypothetical protein